MDLLRKTQDLCNLYNLKPKSSHGQNFLITDRIYNEIIAAANLNKNDIVLEVGPGLGFLTTKLANQVKQVIAVELDSDLATVLQTIVLSTQYQNIEVINQNILDFDINTLSTDYKIVANLPYNITSVFLRKFLSAARGPSSLTLMLQKEVVERIVANPGQHSLLSLSVQFYGEPKLVQLVAKENFWPKPEVDSAILHIKVKTKDKLLVTKAEEKDFFRLLKFGFSAKRKMLKNNLAAAFRQSAADVEKILLSLNFKPQVRAQELSLDDWQKLFAQLK